MPVRATKRGAARTALDRDCDVLVCGASFAGLTLARELEGTGARVLMVDRYEIGERQTSACAAPTDWLELLGLNGAIRQTFDELVVHTSRSTARWPLPFTFSTFDYRELCGCCARARARASSRPRPSSAWNPAALHTVRTDRGDAPRALRDRRARLAARALELPADPTAGRAAFAWSRGASPGLG
jgi:glycine/D-amino acid oxidase-like deaminating enzyme